MPDWIGSTMSRTDKDAPLAVRAAWWEPMHYRCHNDIPGRYWHSGQAVNRECDLPPAPVRHNQVYWRGGPRSCVWVADFDTVYPDGLYPRTHPPKWFVDHVGHNMERRRARDECREALKEYHATGEVDTIPSVNQHRHTAIWLWW